METGLFETPSCRMGHGVTHLFFYMHASLPFIRFNHIWFHVLLLKKEETPPMNLVHLSWNDPNTCISHEKYIYISFK